MDALITIVAPVRDGDVPLLDARIDALANPCNDHARAALDRLDEDGCGTHFMSLHAIASGGEDEDAHLVLEFTADGTARRALERIVAAIGPELTTIFAHARDWRDNVGLFAYLDSHRIEVGSSYFSPPGLCFAGTPGMRVGRILAEAALAKFVAPLVDDGEPDMRPIDRLAEVRRAVAASDFASALEPPLPPGRDGREVAVPQLLAMLAWPFVRAYLWPFAILFVVLAAFLWTLLDRNLVNTLLIALGVTVALILAIAITLYVKLRRQEASDWVDPRAPDRETLAEIGRRENYCAQNHMVSVTTRKPGLVRWLTLRLAFWLIAQVATKIYREGFLGDISTIHAARWITIPGTRKLVFFSNFGGSWESYLEDFITRAHTGLTAVWSNSIGFPRARNLIEDGATDGERFKRYARASMLPTRFWYSAYPHLATDHVRCNAAMRRGLASALTNDEAVQWLALFGSAPRPDAKLETSQIQSIVFGGLGFMPHGACLLLQLPDETAAARAFVAALYPVTAFGDGRKLRHDAVVTVALGARALARLGLEETCLSGFPPAFMEGMGTGARARILGDVDRNAPEHWEWGREPYDLALLVYGREEEPVAALIETIRELAREGGMNPPHRIPLKQVEKPATEPFGFVDGVSQPIIRGSFQSYRKNDPIHLVQPGEFIIGYPDDRGNFPPEPELSPLADPDNRLPVADKSRAFGNTIVEAPRAVGRNGSFLVIRQLEQDVGAFWHYCRDEAERVAARFPQPYDVTDEFVAAKLVGRWPDGSSLVRNPYYPFPKEQQKRQERRDARTTAAGFTAEGAVAATGEPAGDETVRPDTRPEDKRVIPPPAEASHRGDNDFLYGVEDPQATRCPFGAHIRRANPRDSLMPGSMEQVSISNRHRLLRVGRLYQPADGRDPGLLFMCLNGDIERQFEFIQQTWLTSPAFHGLVGEQDPLTSDGRDGATGFIVPTHDGPVRLKPLKRFVRTLGGGYFFLPSRSLLAYLAGI
jgi:deferrochelatase/peroxidase EfeB